MLSRRNQRGWFFLTVRGDSGMGFGKTMYSVYALIYIVAAAVVVVSGVFLVVTSLTP